MSRDLGGYSRDHLPPNIYFPDPVNAPDAGWIDRCRASRPRSSRNEYSKQTDEHGGARVGRGHVARCTGRSRIRRASAVRKRRRTLRRSSNTSRPEATRSARSSSRRTRSRRTRASSSASPTRATSTRRATGRAQRTRSAGPRGIMPTTHVYESFDPTIDPTSAINLRVRDQLRRRIPARAARSSAPTTRCD